MQEKYYKYANLLLKKGLCIDEGQPLLIQAPISAIEFVRVLVVLLAMVLTVPMTTILAKFLED